MYNELLKKQFLTELSEEGKNGHTVNGFVTMFNKFEPFERVSEKDLALMDKDEICEIYNAMSGRGRLSYEYYQVLNSKATSYTEWYVRNSEEKIENAYAELNIKDMSDLLEKQSKYATEIEIKTKVNMLNNPCERFMVAAPFYGIGAERVEELTHLTLSNFNIKNNTVELCTGRILTLPKYLIDIAVASCMTYEKEYYSEKTGVSRMRELHGEGVIKSVQYADTQLGKKFVTNKQIDSMYRRTINIRPGYENFKIKYLNDCGENHFMRKILLSNPDTFVFDLYDYNMLNEVIYRFHLNNKGRSYFVNKYETDKQ